MYALHHYSGHHTQACVLELREISSRGELGLTPKDLQEVHDRSVGHGSLFTPWLLVMTRNIGEFPWNRLGMNYSTQDVLSPSRVVKIFILSCHGRRRIVRRNFHHAICPYFVP